MLVGLRGDDVPEADVRDRTDRDLPGWIVLAVPAAVVIALFAAPGLLAGEMGPLPRLVAALGVAVFGLAFVVVSSRIVGLIGVSSNPTSGMALVTLLGVAVVFVALGWRDPSARLLVWSIERRTASRAAARENLNGLARADARASGEDPLFI